MTGVNLTPQNAAGPVHGIASAVAHRLARAWVSPAEDAPWRWQDDGTVVVWRDGGDTIAFAEEIHACARRLAPVGLPPMTALILLLAAAGPNWPAHADRLSRWPLGDADVPALGDNLAEHRRKALVLLARLREARGGVQRAELAALVFPAGGHYAPGVAAAVLQGLDQGLPPTQLIPEIERDPTAAATWRLLAEGLDGLAGEHFAAAARTGLAAPPPALVLPTPVAGGMRGLIASLRDDPALGPVARLATALLAAVHMPRPLARPDDLPQGGYAGIVNRGPLDRLLPAELAHDDLVLAARIAQGEALYLRRESPPAPLPRARALLLDSGIRSWGVPRIFVLAVALAFAAEARPGAKVKCWRAAGAEVDDIALDNREALLKHLSVLAPAPHPGAALPAWIAALSAAFPDRDAGGDRLLITTAAVVADPAFRAALAALTPPWSPALVATVAADGTYQLLALAHGGARVLAEARFDLKDLLAERAPTVQVAHHSGPLPVIFSLRPFPLLLPHHLDPARAWHHAGRGVLAAAKDGRLMWWATPGKGARELLPRLPAGQPLWLGFSGDTAIALIAAAQGSLVLVRVATANDGGGAAEEIPIAIKEHLGWPQAVEAVEMEDDDRAALLVIGRHLVAAIDPVDGTVLARQGLDEQRLMWCRQRLFHTTGFDQRGDAGFWQLLHWDGNALNLVPAQRVPRSCPEPFLRSGRDGVWALDANGQVLDFTEGRRVHGSLPPGDYALKQLSRDGHRALVTRVHERRSSEHLVVFDECRLLPAETDRLEPGIASLRRLSPNLVTRLDGLFALVQPDGTRLPAFRTAKGNVLALRVAGDRIEFKISAGLLPPADATVVLFRSMSQDAASLRGLEVAYGPHTRCVLDPRGLAHFSARKADHPHAQVTLVLGDGVSAYWCSDGTWGGAPFFLTRKSGNDSQRLIEQLRAFAEGLP